MRRLAVLLATGAGVLAAGLLFAAPASAQEAELDEYLRRAADAEFSGSQIVITEWNDESAAGLYDVRQADGVTEVVQDGGTATMMSDGKVSGSSGRLQVTEWARWRLADRYSTADPEATTRLGRPATSVAVMEDGRMRLLVVFDDQTGAPLLTEVFDDAGNAFRVAVMMDFDPGRAVRSRSGGDTGRYDEMSRIEITGLPGGIAGYWRADTYAGPTETQHAFYTDGLFSFSVFEAAGRSDAGAFAEGGKFRTGGHTYRTLLDPGALQLFWNTPDSSFVLIGDLPPDHLVQVLAELPRPGDPNFLERVWRGLFG